MITLKKIPGMFWGIQIDKKNYMAYVGVYKPERCRMVRPYYASIKLV